MEKIQTKYNFDENEENILSFNYEILKGTSAEFDINKISHKTFLHLPIAKTKISNFLSKYYESIGMSRVIDYSFEDYMTFVYLLTKARDNPDDTVFYQKNVFFVLYDILTDQFNSFQNKEYDYDIIFNIFEYVIHIYIDRNESKIDLINLYEPKKLDIYLMANMNINYKSYKIDNSNLKTFLDLLPNLDIFIKNYLKSILYSYEYGSKLLPSLQEKSSFLYLHELIFYILSNENLANKKFAFKFFDSSIDGFSSATMIHSCTGFEGSVAIIIKHFDKEELKEYIFGGTLNSNIKECYGAQHCGDEKSYLFSLSPRLAKYRVIDNYNKIAYLNTHALQSLYKIAGIGFGNYKHNFRMWIDFADIFKKSYFMKFDDVFEEGSPFDEVEKFLNV